MSNILLLDYSAGCGNASEGGTLFRNTPYIGKIAIVFLDKNQTHFNLPIRSYLEVVVTSLHKSLDKFN